MNWQDISPWVTPAIVLSVVVYFTHFFGKVIADQKAFADNRDWEIEFSGLWFLVDFLLPPSIIAIGTVLYFKASIIGWLAQVPMYIGPITYHWIDFIIIFIIGSYGTVSADIIKRWKYGLPSPNPDVEKDAVEKIFNRVVNINTIFLQMFSMIVIAIFTLEIVSENVFWISIFLVLVFSVLIIIAINYSLMQNPVLRADIYFKDKTEPLMNVLLLKVNDDNIKIRAPGKTSLLDKENILKWEVLDEHNGARNSFVVPLVAWFPWVLSLYLFWENKLLLGIAVILAVPVVIFFFGAFFVPVPRKKTTMDEVGKTISELSKSFPVAAFIGFLSIIIGSIGAWFHNLPLTIFFGIILTFIAWAVFQMNRSRRSLTVDVSGVERTAGKKY